MLAHYEEKAFSKVVIGDWRQSSDSSSMVRDVEYLFPATSMVSANMAYEVQCIKAEEDLLGGFVVHTSTQNPHVMYGKSFKTANQFVFEWLDKCKTRITVSSQVNFNKRPNSFIASQIENGVKQGTKESAELFVDLLASAAGSGSKIGGARTRVTAEHN